MTFRGKLLKNGSIVLPSIMGAMTEPTAPAGATSWSGTFSLPSGEKLAGGLYVLQLDSGQSLDIFLGPVAANCKPVSVTFAGCGPLA